MNVKAMNMFLSEENIKRHLEHLRTHKLKLSILEKSQPELKGKDINEISKMSINRDIREEALNLIWYIKSHECFFKSFCQVQLKSECVLKYFSSREKFLYDLSVEAKEHDHGFLYVYLDRRGVPRTSFLAEPSGAFLKFTPILALDLYEHTYFLDYGFMKDKFISNALIYLDVGKLK